MKTRQKVDELLGKTLIFLMALMVINVLWQVFSRFLVGSPSAFTDELARFLLIWIGILGAAYVSGRNMHVAIDVLPSKFNAAVQKKMLNLVRVLIILFCLTAMVLGGARLVYMTYILDQNSAVLQLPLAVVYMVIPISGVLIIYYKILDILK